jgi:hypothetical protein
MADGWRVTGQRGTEDLVNSRFSEVMVVSVVTDDGTTKDFRIPAAQYTPDNVAAIVGAWFEQQQAVSNL